MTTTSALARLVLVVAVVAASACESPHPTDDLLLGRFRANRPVLERLVRMFEEDKGLVA